MYSLNTYYPTTFWDPALSGLNVACTLNVCMAAMLMWNLEGFEERREDYEIELIMPTEVFFMK
jgi:hypothetical protein